MKQRMHLPLTADRPKTAPPKGAVVGVFKKPGKDGRSRTYKYIATGEAWKTFSEPHVMSQANLETGKPEKVTVEDGYHYLPTKQVLVAIGK